MCPFLCPSALRHYTKLCGFIGCFVMGTTTNGARPKPRAVSRLLPTSASVRNAEVGSSILLPSTNLRSHRAITGAPAGKPISAPDRAIPGAPAGKPTSAPDHAEVAHRSPGESGPQRHLAGYAARRCRRISTTIGRSETAMMPSATSVKLFFTIGTLPNANPAIVQIPTQITPPATL